MAVGVAPSDLHFDPPALSAKSPCKRGRLPVSSPRHARRGQVARPILFPLSDAASFVSGAHLDASGGGFVIGRGEDE